MSIAGGVGMMSLVKWSERVGWGARTWWAYMQVVWE